MNNHKPATHRDHPINSVLRLDESFRELARKVEYCEITWPQSYEMGEPIRLKSEEEPEEISLFQSGVILSLCLVGMVLIVAICATLNACGVW